MAESAHHGQSAGWRAVSGLGFWRQAVVAGTAGAVSMAVLACALSLVRDTTGHDWYAAYKLTVADLMLGAGFGRDTSVEYRNSDGAVETVSRYGLTHTFEARWARKDILKAARDGATLGAIAGFGGALLCLVLLRRSIANEVRAGRNAYDPAPAQRAEALDRPAFSSASPESAPVPARPRSAPPQPATAAPVRALADRSPASAPPGPAKPEPALARRGAPDDGGDNEAVPARHGGTKRDYGRWV